MNEREETTVERQAKMRERAKQLKEQREAERLAVVHDKFDQQWRSVHAVEVQGSSGHIAYYFHRQISYHFVEGEGGGGSGHRPRNLGLLRTFTHSPRPAIRAHDYAIYYTFSSYSFIIFTIRIIHNDNSTGSPQSAGPVAYATSAIWLIRHWVSVLFL